MSVVNYFPVGTKCMKVSFRTLKNRQDLFSHLGNIWLSLSSQKEGKQMTGTSTVQSCVFSAVRGIGKPFMMYQPLYTFPPYFKIRHVKMSLYLEGGMVGKEIK